MERRKSTKKKSKSLKSDNIDLSYLKDYSTENPDFMEYDLQAIYKKDGLQFDECWQERMLQRYQLMKCQREKRQSSASLKREKLQIEKKYKILSHNPELLYPKTRMLFEDNKILANNLLNSSLLTGNHNYSCQPHLNSPTHPLLPLSTIEAEPPPGGPPSEVDGPQQLGVTLDSKLMIEDDEINELPSKYRFTLRSNFKDESSQVHNQASLISRPNTACSSYIPSTHKSFSSKSVKDSLCSRPRSSCSIPGKTKYILIKSNTPTKTNTRTPSPTKLEETLLRQRFPVQHLALMKSLGVSYDSTITKWQEEKQNRSTNFRPKSAKSNGSAPLSRDLHQKNTQPIHGKSKCYFSLDSF